MTDEKKPLIPERYFWPTLIVSILLFSVCVNMYLVFRATSDNGPQIVDNYYDKAVKFDESRAAQAASDRLGWQAEVSLVAAKPGERSVQILVRDLDGKPVSGLQGTVELRSPSLSRPLGEAKVEEVGVGLYRAKIVGEGVERAGLFDTTVKLSKPSVRSMFLHEKRHEVM